MIDSVYLEDNPWPEYFSFYLGAMTKGNLIEYKEIQLYMNIKTFNSSENDTLPYVGNWDPHASMNESDKITHKIISIDP